MEDTEEVKKIMQYIRKSTISFSSQNICSALGNIIAQDFFNIGFSKQIFLKGMSDIWDHYYALPQSILNEKKFDKSEEEAKAEEQEHKEKKNEKYTPSFMDTGNNFFSVYFDNIQYSVTEEAALIARSIFALVDTLEKIKHEK